MRQIRQTQLNIMTSYKCMEFPVEPSNMNAGGLWIECDLDMDLH